MRAVFGLALGCGLLALFGWIAATAVAGSVEGWQNIDPDRRFGLSGRRIVAALVGFGMAGLSAAYAGWPIPVATIAAGGGAIGAAALAGIAR